MIGCKIDVLPVHMCGTKNEVKMQCLDEDGNYIIMIHAYTICHIYFKGIEHQILFATCKCEPIAMTLVRARLWPATPQNPHYAFCFDLLDWAEALLLECQVSLKDLCEALYFKCPHLVIKVLLTIFSE